VALRTPRRRGAGQPAQSGVGDVPTHRVDLIVAAPHEAFRHGIRASLGLDFGVVGEAGSVSELRDVLATTQADLLLVDEALPGGGLVAAMRAAPASVRVVAFVDAIRHDQVIEALRLGAVGYLLKDISPARLSATLRSVMEGEPALTRSALGALVDEVVRLDGVAGLSLPDGGRVALTPRERQVAVLLKAGRTTDEISAELGIAPVTARRHISELMRKLGVATRDDAIARLNQ